GEYSIEAWVVPGNVNQEDAPIVALSGGAMVRNFALEQDLNSYVFKNRSSVTDAAGMPAIATVDDDRILQATLQHVVVSFDPVNGRSLHVNGERIPLEDEVGGGLLGDWDDTFAFVLGNEVSGDMPWEGVLRMVAVHDRVLSDEEIQQNMDAGVGERFFLLFDVSEHVGVPRSFVLFEVSRFDTHAYLFANPRLINLDGDPALAGVRLADMRIGMNGVEVPIGQVFRDIDVVADPDALSEGLGQELSGAGAVVPVERGPELDQFFLSFGTLGDAENISVEPVAAPLPESADLEPQPKLGLRTFDRIDATMSRVTGVPSTTPSVRETFELVRGQLPGLSRLDTFVPAHQIGITQLAIAYCDVLIEDPTRRAEYFPGFDFGAGPGTAFSPAGRDAFFGPIITNMLGSGLDTQPEAADVRAELDALVDRLTASGSGGERTRAIGKAACSAVLAGAPILLI
ncbi:MAG: LamG domain-containing protein, partial [Pseudomonadales bacterium]|nr:LamG domain-containing protein [Pseudomonadales bacterium]